MDPLTHEDDLIIAVCGTVAGLLSLMGSLSIIIMFTLQYIKGKALFYQKLVLYLTFSDLLWNLTTTINQIYFLVQNSYQYPIPGECKASGFLQQWFEVSCDFWVASMSIYMYLKIVKKIDSDDKEYIFHLVCWAIPFGIALLPLSGMAGGYGFTGAWCWIVNTEARLFFSYMFAWTTFAIIIISYALIIKYIRFVQQDVDRIDESRQRRTYKGVFRKLSTYPVVFLVQWTPATINRIQNIIAPNNPIAILYILHITIINLSGFLNGILYGGIIYKQVFPTCFQKHTRLSSRSTTTSR